MRRLVTLCYLISFCFAVLLIYEEGPEAIEFFGNYSLLLQNQSGFLDALASQPLREKHQFYLYNITNGEQFLQSDDTVEVDEVGPFAYYGVDSSQAVGSDGHVRSLSLRDLRFSLNESVADESVFVYTLNIQSIRNLSSESSFLKSTRRNLVHKTTVGDFLREIVDGLSLGTTGVDPFPETEGQIDVRSQFNELRDDVSSNYLQYLRNEICLRIFRVVRFVNPPTHTLARLFQKFPCECLTIKPNGTENVSRKHPEYPDIRTSKYLFQWNDELCSRSPYDPFFPIQKNRSVNGNLFWVSSPAYWKNKSSVRYRSVVEEARETWIKVEPMSDVVTDFFFEYQLNLPVQLVDERSHDVLNIYPVLLTVTNGVSGEQVESSILRFILYPKQTVVDYIKLFGFWLSLNLVSGFIMLLMLIFGI